MMKWSGKEDRSKYIDFLSLDNWKKTSMVRKRMHTLRNCKCCLVFHPKVQESFPVKFNRARVNKHASPYTTVKDKVKRTIKLTPKQSEVKEIGKTIVESFDTALKENLGMGFTDVISMVPGSGLAKRKLPGEKKKENRALKRKFKETIEDGWSQNDHTSANAYHLHLERNNA